MLLLNHLRVELSEICTPIFTTLTVQLTLVSLFTRSWRYCLVNYHIQYNGWRQHLDNLFDQDNSRSLTRRGVASESKLEYEQASKLVKYRGFTVRAGTNELRISKIHCMLRMISRYVAQLHIVSYLFYES